MSTCFFVYVTADGSSRVRQHVLCMCARLRSVLIRRWSGGSPAVLQIGTSDLCLCYPLICLPRCTIIPPLPTSTDRWRLFWGGLDLRCAVSRHETGSDWIKLGSLWACMCLGAGKRFGYQRGFLGIFSFSQLWVQWISQHLFWCPGIFKPLGFKGLKYIKL